MNLGAMLNAYPDSMGGNLSEIARALDLPQLRGAFRSFYILPSLFHTDLDRGFSVISYDLDRRMATREDIENLKAQGIDLKLDFILNHPPSSRTFCKRGTTPPTGISSLTGTNSGPDAGK